MDNELAHCAQVPDSIADQSPTQKKWTFRLKTLSPTVWIVGPLPNDLPD